MAALPAARLDCSWQGRFVPKHVLVYHYSFSREKGVQNLLRVPRAFIQP